MTARLTGQSVDRVEGPRLLRGEGRFVGNIRHPDLLHIAFVRSQMGHADILSVDIETAEDVPGVVAVFTAEHLEGVVAPIAIAGPPSWPSPPSRRWHATGCAPWGNPLQWWWVAPDKQPPTVRPR